MTETSMQVLRARWAKVLAAWAVVALSLGLLTGCDAEDRPATAITVTVTAHAELAPLLRRIRASVYESDARDGGVPVQSQDFVLGDGLDAGLQASLPFSFAITPGRAARFLLVIEGFASLDPAEAPLIEQKQIGAFTADETKSLSVLLASRCAQLYYPCAGLTQTCWPEARACGPLREAQTTPAAEVRGIDAGTLPSRDPPGCPRDACDPNYPCTPTPPDGYVCLGALADYPMPYFGSKTPPAYDLSEPGIAVDRVTGLAWQRERPDRYAGCSGASRARGDECTLDEAKRYCAHLALGGRSWRLPSRPELESLLDFHVAEAPWIDKEVFPDTADTYWTSSTLPVRVEPDGYYTLQWSFIRATRGVALSDDELFVRCVSGVPNGRGTPERRFVVDATNDTVSDQASALTWQRAPSVVAKTIDEARAYCGTLGPGWRLPHPKELLGITDASRIGPSLPAVFPPPAHDSAWSELVDSAGTLVSVTVEQSLGALFELGNVSSDGSALVRCVR